MDICHLNSMKTAIVPIIKNKTGDTSDKTIVVQ